MGLEGGSGFLVGNTPKIVMSGVAVSIIEPAATFTTLTYNNNGGFVQLQSAGVHGLTTTPAVGKALNVTWAGGNGVNGLYNILSVDSTTLVTINYVHAAGLGTPTVTVLNTAVTLLSYTIPGGTLGPNGLFRWKALLSFTNSGSNKVIRNTIGGNTILGITTASGYGVAYTSSFQNRNSVSSQICGPSNTLTGLSTAPGSSDISVQSVNTGADVVFAITAQPVVANEHVTLESYFIEIFPG